MKEDRGKALAEQKADREKLEKDKEENGKLLLSLASEMEKLKTDFRKAEALWQSHRQNQSRMQDDSDSFAMEQKKLEESWRKTQEQSARVKRDMAERQGRIDNFKAQEAEEIKRLQESHMTLREAEALRLPGSMQDMKRKRKGWQENWRNLEPSIPTGKRTTPNSWKRESSMRCRLRI